MKLKETFLAKQWIETSKFLGGEFSMPYQQVNGGLPRGGLYHFRIDLKYRNVNVRIHAGILELPLKKDEYKETDITITGTKKNNENIELSIWRKDWMDKLFNSGITTGFKEFDKIIGLKSSKNIERFISQAFKNERLRNDLINNRHSTFNIQTIDKITTIQRKSGLRIRSILMMKNEYDGFCRFIDGLIDSGIINANA